MGGLNRAAMDVAECCRLMDQYGKRDTPSAGMDFPIWRPTSRKKSESPRRDIRRAGLGLTTRGLQESSGGQPVWQLARLLRKASPRKALGILERPGQVGRIPTMNTDTSHSFTAMA